MRYLSEHIVCDTHVEALRLLVVVGGYCHEHHISAFERSRNVEGGLERSLFSDKLGEAGRYEAVFEGRFLSIDRINLALNDVDNCDVMRCCP